MLHAAEIMGQGESTVVRDNSWPRQSPSPAGVDRQSAGAIVAAIVPQDLMEPGTCNRQPCSSTLISPIFLKSKAVLQS